MNEKHNFPRKEPEKLEKQPFKKSRSLLSFSTKSFDQKGSKLLKT